jgi:hypothetical protein
MSDSLSSIISPPILFFVLGFCAQIIKTDLRLPDQISKFFAVYLLVVIGFEGGVKIATAGIDWAFLSVLIVGLVFALIHPVIAYFLTRTKMDKDTSIAVSSSYGSVSVVTFIAALSFLENQGFDSNSKLIAVLAVMEFPAILMGVLIHGLVSENVERSRGWRKKLVHEAFFGYAPLILVGSLLIGGITGEEGSMELQSFTKGLFKGFLSLYLLDSGARAAAEFKKTRVEAFHFAFGIGFPIFKGLVGCLIAAKILGLGHADSLLLAILFASASYIAVPAAMTQMLPGANRGIYVTLPLAITFPFNVIIGIPLFNWFLGSVLN